MTPNQEMSRTRTPTTLLAAGVISILFLTACSQDSGTSPEQNISSSISQPASQASKTKDVPAFTLSLPSVVRTWDTSDVAFAEAVTAGDNYVTIGFKEPASTRVRSSGVRAAVSKETILAGQRMLLARGATIIYELEHIGAVVVQMDPEAAAQVRSDPVVDYAEPRLWGDLAGTRVLRAGARAAPAALQPPAFGHTDPWGVIMVRAPEAWAAGGTGFGAKILLVDTGYEKGHEDLPVALSFHCGGTFDGCSDWQSGDYLTHGSHVMGTFTARDDFKGVVGVAPLVGDASVYVWGGCSGLTRNCPGDDVAAGINAGITWGVGVINLSLSWPSSTYPVAVANEVAAAVAGDIIIAAAAGNNLDNVLRFPAADPGVIGVSGVQANRSFASTSPCVLPNGDRAKSNWGPHVDISAPFWALSTVPFSAYEDQQEGWCGTSMATPHVAGAAAVLRGRFPTLTAQEIENFLTAGADDRGDPGWDPKFGHGILDVARALELATPPGAPLTTVAIFGPSNVRENDFCTWFADVSDGTAPYSYSWVKGSAPVGSGAELNMETGTNGFTLKLTITDSGGRKGSDTRSVTVTPSGPMCFF